MSAQEQLNKLRELLRGAYNTIQGKGGSVPAIEERTMSNLSAAIESVPSPVKVKIAKSLRVSNDCIGEDGTWGGEKIIDISNVTSLANCFQDCPKLSSIDLSNWDTSNVTTLVALFSKCTQLTEANLSGWDTSKVTKFQSVFHDNKLIEITDLTSWNASLSTSTQYLFYVCNKLKSIVGKRTIDDVVKDDIKVMSGINSYHNQTYFNHTILERPSLRAVINGLADLTGQDPQTLILGGTLIAKLTEEDIAIATAKNWTIA